MDVKSYVCPNCGANTTNAQNCEYCGSLLVRFVEKGVDLSHTSYTNNSEVFPGLIEELNRNLKLQEENPGVLVSTELFKETDLGLDDICIMSRVMWGDDTESPEFKQETKTQLCITFDIGTYTEELESFKECNDEQYARLAKFRRLDSFPLFTVHNYTDEDGYSGREFAVNLGEDAAGAARIVSEILTKVYGWSSSEAYNMFTNVGEENISQAINDAWEAAHDIETNSDSVSHNSKDDTVSSLSIWDIFMWICYICIIGCIFLVFIKLLANE